MTDTGAEIEAETTAMRKSFEQLEPLSGVGQERAIRWLCDALGLPEPWEKPRRPVTRFAHEAPN